MNYTVKKMLGWCYYQYFKAQTDYPNTPQGWHDADKAFRSAIRRKKIDPIAYKKAVKLYLSKVEGEMLVYFESFPQNESV